MKMKKILTIIIPTYNMEKYLHKCLDSLIVSEGNMQRLEVLVVNDGSKDASSQIAHEYEAKYSQTFRVIDKENGNYGSCVNRGLKEATGKYVKVLDADDYFENQVFDEYLSFLSDKDVDLVISDYSIVDENGKIVDVYNFPLPMDEVFSLNTLPDKTIEWLWHHGITYRKDIFNHNQYVQTEGISYTDDEWIFKPMVDVHEILYFPHCLYMYLRGREGQTFDPNVLKNEFGKRFIVLRSMLNFYVEKYGHISSEAERYMSIKLWGRLQPAYIFYLIKHSTKEGNLVLKDFDQYLQSVTPSIYEGLNNLSSSKGWHFIRRWRDSNYNRFIPMLILMRIKFQCRMILKHDYQDRMDNKYKRKA